MFRYFSKNKGVLLLMVVVLGCFLWMTSQVRRPGRAGLAERVINVVSYPFAVAIKKAGSGVSGVWEGYFSLVGAGRENRRLREENAKLAFENLRLREAVLKERRLTELWDLKEETSYPSIAAGVIGRDATSWFKSAWINKGESSGVFKNMPAVVYTGVVGKVIKPYGSDARLLLVTDPSSAVSCITERTREPGILVGEGGGSCRLLYVGKHADVQPGDLVLTSGLDGIFPKGMPVGDVAGVSRNTPGYFLEIDVRPTADIAHIEEVLLLQYVPPPVPPLEPAQPMPAQGVKR